MIAWIALPVIGLLVVGALIRFAHLPRMTWEPLGIAVLLGLAGYAWQGSPSLAGVPRTSAQQPNLFNEDMVERRNAMVDQYGGAAQWLTMADGLDRAGDHRGAVDILRQAVRLNPDKAELWVALGNSIVLAAQGAVPPAADFAFDKAIAIAPAAQAPGFFKGLAHAQEGDFTGAAGAWQALLDRAPADAKWRDDIALRLRAIAVLRQEMDAMQAQPQ